MSYLLIIANTPSENTRSLCDAVANGAKEGDFPLRLLEPLSATPDDVLGASGVILGTTENFGYMSGQMKDFFERIYYPCLENKQGLPWALYVSAGQDGTGAVSSIERIVTGLRWRKTQEPLVIKSPFTESDLDDCHVLGQSMAMGLKENIF